MQGWSSGKPALTWRFPPCLCLGGVLVAALEFPLFPFESLLLAQTLQPKYRMRNNVNAKTTAKKREMRRRRVREDPCLLDLLRCAVETMTTSCDTSLEALLLLLLDESLDALAALPRWNAVEFDTIFLQLITLLL